jgi:hypothetical protein
LYLADVLISEFFTNWGLWDLRWLQGKDPMHLGMAWHFITRELRLAYESGQLDQTLEISRRGEQQRAITHLMNIIEGEIFCEKGDLEKGERSLMRGLDPQRPPIEVGWFTFLSLARLHAVRGQLLKIIEALD